MKTPENKSPMSAEELSRLTTEGRSQWIDGKTEVLIRRELNLLKLGVTIPAGSYARVIRRIASDAAEVEFRGTCWVEIFISDDLDDTPKSVDIVADQLRQQAVSPSALLFGSEEMVRLKRQIAEVHAIAEPLATNPSMRQILNVLKN